MVVVWIVTVASLALLHYVDVSAPAFHELLIPFYWIPIIAAGVITWRWARSRSATDRRHTDRRRSSRREDYDSAQAADPERDEK